jgi:S-adenosylmethionine hydrolase
MSIVTFISDYGPRDYHVAIAKAQLLNWSPAAIAVDIAHSVEHFDLVETAYLMKSCWKSFPMGTTHVLGVKSQLSRMPLVAVKDNQYFVSADNGVLAMILDEFPDELYEIDLPIQDADASFPMGNIFMQIAAHLSRGGHPQMIGKRTDYWENLSFPQAYLSGGGIQCQVVHIDDYGNMVLNFTRQMFQDYIGHRNFVIHARATHKSGLRNIYNTFQPKELADGIPFATWGVNDFLVVAMKNATILNGGGAARLMGYQKMSNIFIEFND